MNNIPHINDIVPRAIQIEVGAKLESSKEMLLAGYLELKEIYNDNQLYEVFESLRSDIVRDINVYQEYNLNVFTETSSLIDSLLKKIDDLELTYGDCLAANTIIEELYERELISTDMGLDWLNKIFNKYSVEE